MDTVTHTLIGLTIYGAIDKRNMTKPMKRSLLFTAVVGSNLPDIDIVSRIWDQSGQYLMWHRGLTHSILFVPLWAFLLWFFCAIVWKVKHWHILAVGLVAVFVHSTLDIFNTWGTGYLEPFSGMRLSLGVLPIVDFVILGVIIIGFSVHKLKPKIEAHKVYRAVAALIFLHIFLQAAQGLILYNEAYDDYERLALAARFTPGHFSVVGKNDNVVDVHRTTVWGEKRLEYQFVSDEEWADVDRLFQENPHAAVLYEWAPFVVIVEDAEKIAIFDPRYYRDGRSFHYEYVLKNIDNDDQHDEQRADQQAERNDD